MSVKLLSLDGRILVAEIELPELADVVVLGKESKRYFVRQDGYRYHEAVVAFVDSES